MTTSIEQILEAFDELQMGKIVDGLQVPSSKEDYHAFLTSKLTEYGEEERNSTVDYIIERLNSAPASAQVLGTDGIEGEYVKEILEAARKGL